MRTNFQVTLDEFVKIAQLDQRLTLDGNGAVFFTANDIEIGLFYLEQSDSVQIMTMIGAAEEETSGTFFKMLLVANHFQSMTRGGAIGFDEEENVISLNRRLGAAGLTGTALAAAVRDMVELTVFWRANIADLLKAERSLDGGDDAAPENEWIRL